MARSVRLISAFLFGVFLFSLPFPRVVVNLCWVLWLVAWLLEGRWLHLLTAKERLKDKRLWVVLGFCLLWIWEALSALWAEQPALTGQMVGRHAYILAIAIIMLFGVNDYYRKEWLLPALFWGAVVSVPCYLIMRHVTPADDIANGFTDPFKHRLYYCMVLTIALAALPWLYDLYKGKKIILLLHALGVLVILAGIYMTQCRIILVALTVMTLAAILMTSLTYLRRHPLGASIALLVLGGLLTLAFVTNSRMKNIPYDERLYIWRMAEQHHSQWPWYGIGIAQQERLLDSYYEQAYQETGSDYYCQARNNHYSTHNNYLYYYLCLGPLSVVFLLLLFAAFPMGHYGRERTFMVLMMLMFMVCMLTEDLLMRQEGTFCLYAALLLPFIIAYHHDKDCD